jgi:hypothetical protein
MPPPIPLYYRMLLLLPSRNLLINPVTWMADGRTPELM